MIKIMRMLFERTPARYQVVTSVSVRKFVRVPVHTDDTHSPHMYPVVSLSPWHNSLQAIIYHSWSLYDIDIYMVQL